MGALNLIPLVILFAVVAGVGWVGYQVRQLATAPFSNESLTHAPAALPLLKRTRRAWQEEDGEEERCLDKGRRKGRSEGSQYRDVCGQDTTGICEDVECRARWVSVATNLRRK
jgi:hypothetical protein